MSPDKFTEEDKKKVVDFLNMVAKKAKFELNTQEVIDYFKLLSYMQQTVLKKIDANILEVKRVIETEKDDSSEEKGE